MTGTGVRNGAALLMAAMAMVVCGATACGSDGGGTGPGTPSGSVSIGIISGNHQTVVARDTALGAPVVGKLVRGANGSVSFVILRRVGDFLVPTAGAQTVVNGSPIVGATVCAVATDSVHYLTPFSPCVNTDTAGHATFNFKSPHIAGVATAQIRGEVSGAPVVFDTASATVMADSVQVVHLVMNNLGHNDGSELGPIAAGTVIDFHAHIAGLADQYGNAVDTSTVTPTYVQESAPLSSFSTPPATTSSGWTVTLAPGTETIFVKFGLAEIFFTVETQ